MLLGVHASVTLDEVLAGKARVQDAIIGVEPNLWLLPASAGLLEARDADPFARDRLIRLFNECPWEMDVILVDIGAGIQSNVLSLHSPVFQSWIVVTPEPTSMTDAYGLIKLLRRHCGITEVSVVVNQVTDGREARAVYQKLRDVAARFIDVRIDYLGHWERDEKITRSVMNRKILLDWDAGARSIPSLELLAKQVRSRYLQEVAQGHEGLPVSSVLGVPGLENTAHGANTAGFWRTLLGTASAGSNTYHASHAPMIGAPIFEG
jgi:flagellar biosynthesis protein FlhG